MRKRGTKRIKYRKGRKIHSKVVKFKRWRKDSADVRK